MIRSVEMRILSIIETELASISNGCRAGRPIYSFQEVYLCIPNISGACQAIIIQKDRLFNSPSISLSLQKSGTSRLFLVQIKQKHAL